MSENNSPPQPNPDQVDEVEALIQAIEDRLTRIVPIKLCAPANRRPLAEAFVEMLGRLVEFLEPLKPLNQGQIAALLYFVDGLKLDHVGEDNSFIMLTMLGAAKNFSRELRRARHN
jgi:hypothetical protein